MTRAVPLLLSIVLALPLTLRADGADEAQIRALRAQSNDAIARQDVPAIVSFFDDPYQITTSIGSMSQGVAGETAGLEALFRERPDARYVRTPDAVEISASNPLAFESGRWVGTWTTAAGGVKTGGAYSAMWHKVDGEWKIRSELFVALYCEGKDCP